MKVKIKYIECTVREKTFEIETDRTIEEIVDGGTLEMPEEEWYQVIDAIGLDDFDNEEIIDTEIQRGD